jgi:hypothetical protein
MPQTCPSSVVSPGRVRSQWGLIALLVGLASTVGVSLGAQATTTWTVCASGCDYTRIKAAIAAPTTVDGDTLAIAAGTYTEPGTVVNKSLTLQGADAATTIVQAAATRGTATDRVFTIASGVTATLQDLTIRHGRAMRVAGGGIWNEGTLTLTQSIVASNPRGRDCHHASGTVTSTGYNLDSDGSCRLTDSTDLPDTNPQLGPLRDNGGPTLTHALLPGSPAIDAIPWGTNGCGTTLISDQHGRARPQPAGGACDIGASEVDVAGHR